MCRRGEIYNVDFGNNENSYKQCGVRPALVVSNNRANENSPVVTVVPLTARVWKASVGLSKPSMALAEQVETLDKNQLLEKLGEVYDEMVMQQITIALQIQIGVYAEYN